MNIDSFACLLVFESSSWKCAAYTGCSSTKQQPWKVTAKPTPQDIWYYMFSRFLNKPSATTVWIKMCKHRFFQGVKYFDLLRGMVLLGEGSPIYNLSVLIQWGKILAIFLQLYWVFLQTVFYMINVADFYIFRILFFEIGLNIVLI